MQTAQRERYERGEQRWCVCMHVRFWNGARQSPRVNRFNGQTPGRACPQWAARVNNGAVSRKVAAGTFVGPAEMKSFKRETCLLSATHTSRGPSAVFYIVLMRHCNTKVPKWENKMHLTTRNVLFDWIEGYKTCFLIQRVLKNFGFLSGSWCIDALIYLKTLDVNMTINHYAS